MKIIEKESPQLIVGLDSLDENANYIYILAAKENANYYCPCCNGLIKPRAYKKDIDYRMQAHFYHVTGGCSEETYVHYICKNWLFEKGCKFIVNSVDYEVDHIEIEKTLHTSFGDYRPDIIVTTTIGKVFYFEIKSTNKKTDLYAPKWDELRNDVVEVDTRYFINQKYKDNIPTFELIYSDGVCFIKRYSRTNYTDTIAKRKLEWKRQDILNYKIQWERLDWFWLHLQNYTENKDSLETLKSSFKELTYEDKVWVYFNVKSKSCIDIKNIFIDIINDEFIEWLKSLCGKYKDDDRFNISYVKSQRKIHFYVNYINDGYKTTVFSKDFVSCKGIYKKENIDNLEPICKEKSENLDKKLEHIRDLEKIPYIQKISPYNEWAKSNYPIDEIKFNIYFQDNFYNSSIKNYIGVETWVSFGSLTHNFIKCCYEYRLDKFQDNFYKNELYKKLLEKDLKFIHIVKSLREKCDSLQGFNLKVSDNYKTIRLAYRSQTFFNWEFDDSYIFGEFEDELLNQINEKIYHQLEVSKMDRNKKAKITRIVNLYVKQINNHPTTKWTFRVDYKKRWIIGLLGYEMYFEPDYCIFPDDNLENYVEKRIVEAMTILKDKLKSGLPFYNGATCTLYPQFRLMEEK